MKIALAIIGIVLAVIVVSAFLSACKDVEDEHK